MSGSSAIPFGPFTGQFDPDTIYQPGQILTWGGSTYIATQQVGPMLSFNSTYFQLIAEAGEQGPPGTDTVVSGITNVAATGAVSGFSDKSGNLPLTITPTGVLPGIYDQVAVNAAGQVTAASKIAYLTGNQPITVTGDATGFGGTMIAMTLAPSGVGNGTYNQVVVNAKGLVTSAAFIPPAPQPIITVAGDVNGSGAGEIIATLAPTGVVPGTYNQVVVDAKGRVTSAAVVSISGSGSLVATPSNAMSVILSGAVVGSASSSTGTLAIATVLAASGVTPGTYNSVVVDATGRVTSASFVPPVAPGLSSITATGDVSGATSTGTLPLTLAAVGVAGTYSQVVTDAKGRVIAGANPAIAFPVSSVQGRTGAVTLNALDITAAQGFTSYPNTNPSNFIAANQPITISGDASGSGATAIALTLASSGVTAGSYTNFTVDAKGRVTSARAVAAGDVTSALGFTPYSATNPSGYIATNQTITVSGDATGSGGTAIALTLASTGVTPGAYGNATSIPIVTVNSKGLVTSIATIAASGGTSGATAGITAITVLGDITGSYANGTLPLTLAPVGAVGTYTQVITDSKGRVVGGGNPVISFPVSSVFGRTGAITMASNDVTTALGFAPYNATNPSGYISANQSIAVSGDASGSGSTAIALTLAAVGTAGTYSQVVTDAKGRVIAGSTPAINFPVTSVFGRTGTVTLQSPDVTGALGFTPLSTNQSITVFGDASGTGATSIALTLASTGVTPGTYNSVTVNTKGLVTAASNIAPPVQNLTLIGDVSGTSSTGTLTATLAASGVSPGMYGGTTAIPVLTVNSKGLVTSLSTVGVSIAATGDVIGTYSNGTLPLALAAVGTSGTYSQVVTDTKGRVIAGSTPAIAFPVTSVFGRTGSIVLQSLDVSAALGFTPYSSANPSGYVSTINASGDVTGSGGTAIALTLAAVGTSGTYSQVVTDAKGRVISGSTPPIAFPVTSVFGRTGSIVLQSTDISAALGFAPYNATNPSGYISANQAIVVTGDVSGSGSTAIPLTLATVGTAGTYTQVVTDAKGRVISGSSPSMSYPVTSVFGRTGSITLQSTDVTGVLGFTPYSNTNPSGFIAANQPIAVTGDATGSGATAIPLTLAASGVTAGSYTHFAVDAKGRVTSARVIVSSDITGALGFTPISANQSIAISGDASGNGATAIALTLAAVGTAGTYTQVVTDAKGRVISGANPVSASPVASVFGRTGTIVMQSSDVTTALGFTPYNTTNPSGYISANQSITVSGDATGTGGTAIALTLAASGVTAGSYTHFTVDAKGRVTFARALATADVTGALGYTPLSTNQTITVSGDATGSGGTAIALTLASTGVTAGTYTHFTVDAKGRVTTARALATADVTTALGYTPYNSTNPSGYISANQSIAVTGDVTGTGATIIAATLAAVGTAGTYTQVVTDAKGRVISGSNPVSSGSGAVTSVFGRTGSIVMAASDVTTALTYTPYNATNPSGYISTNKTITISGAASGSGATSIALTLASTGVSPGTYNNVVVNSQGLVTSASNVSYSSGGGGVTTGSMTIPWFNAKSYGATANGTTNTIQSQYGSVTVESLASTTVNGTTPFGWATNSQFGLKFSMPLQVSQSGTGTSLNFTYSTQSSQGLPWKASMPYWLHPSFGNCIVKVGMQVSGTGIPSGTTISSIPTTTVTMSDNGNGPQDNIAYPTGTIVLSNATTSALSAGATINFEIQPSDLQGRTLDWLGLQASLANGAAQFPGGRVYWPAGQYMLSNPLLNPILVQNTNNYSPANLLVTGDGIGCTQIYCTSDFGYGNFAIGLSSRGNGSAVPVEYRDFLLSGPNPSSVTRGVSPVAMSGLAMGTVTRLYFLRVLSFRAGIDLVGDHQQIHQVTGTNCGYGLYFGQFSDSMGNQAVEHCSFAGNYCAGVAIATTNQFDSAIMRDVHTGFGPMGFYLEPSLPGVTQTQIGWLSNSEFDSIWIEECGREWIHGYQGTGNIGVNLWTNIVCQPNAINNGNAAVSNGSGGNIQALGMIYCNMFQKNNFVGCSLGGAYQNVSQGVFVATGTLDYMDFHGDSGIILNQGSIPCFSSPQDTHFVTFRCPQFQGRYRKVTNGPVNVGTPVTDYGQWCAPFYDGAIFVGLALVTGAQNVYIPIAREGYFLNAVVADTSQTMGGGQAVYPTNTPTCGFTGGLDGTGCVGVSVNYSGTGNTGFTLNLGYTPTPTKTVGYGAGVPANGTYTISNPVVEISASGANGTIVVPIIPVGSSIRVFNDSGNALTFALPENGGFFASTSNQIAAGAARDIYRLSATNWR